MDTPYTDDELNEIFNEVNNTPTPVEELPEPLQETLDELQANVEEYTDSTLNEESNSNDEEDTDENEEENEYEDVEEESNAPLEISNSETLLIKENLSRFRGASWFDIAQKQNITILGMGGIGSWASLLLSRVKPNTMFLWDGDIVETANMSGQLYSQNSVGMPKPTAIFDIINNFSSYSDIFCRNEMFTEESEATDVMICGFDNMEARQLVFKKWIELVNSKPKEERKYCLLLDGRMAAESIQIFCMTGDDDYYIAQYKKDWLFNNSEADATVCSYKQTSFCSAIMGGLITNLFVNFCTNLGNPNIPRDLPFKTIYEADMMYFKTES